MHEILSSKRSHSDLRAAKGTLSTGNPKGEFVSDNELTRTFSVLFALEVKAFGAEHKILEIPEVLLVRLRQHDPVERNRQNYPAFKMPDGSVPVLEAVLSLQSEEHPDWNEMILGFPMAMLGKQEECHNVALHFSGVKFSLSVDGEELDADFPFGYPPWPERCAWSMDPQFVKKAAIYFPGLESGADSSKSTSCLSDIQYWTPPGHNNWVGDVVTFFHFGRYHLFYLYDRRHHQSKFGKGGHFFAHISTADFKTWTEHEAAVPLEDQSESIGTGTPFVFNGKFCLSYGLHTTRMQAAEKTMLPAQWEYLRRNSRTKGFKRGSIPGFPAGATYSVSEDGVSKFKRTWIMFHPCENPGVFTDSDGRLKMMASYGAKGIWESESPDGGWRCINPEFPPGGDCTFFFRWGEYDYIIGGVTGLWSKPAGAPDSAYEDVVKKGLDFYDGSNVPAITEIGGGRFLMASWIPIRGWGGPLIMRELVQFPDGRIGSKWMKELVPGTGAQSLIGGRIDGTLSFPAGTEPFILTLKVHPGKNKGRLGIVFLPGGGEGIPCEFQINLQERRAQFAPGSDAKFADAQKSLREGGMPHHAGDYAIENLINVDGPFEVRVIVKGCAKLGGTLIDAEIAGSRTMISYRPDLYVGKILFRTENTVLADVRISRLEDC